MSSEANRILKASSAPFTPKTNTNRRKDGGRGRGRGGGSRAGSRGSASAKNVPVGRGRGRARGRGKYGQAGSRSRSRGRDHTPQSSESTDDSGWELSPEDYALLDSEDGRLKLGCSSPTTGSSRKGDVGRSDKRNTGGREGSRHNDISRHKNGKSQSANHLLNFTFAPRSPSVPFVSVGTRRRQSQLARVIVPRDRFLFARSTLYLSEPDVPAESISSSLPFASSSAKTTDFEGAFTWERLEHVVWHVVDKAPRCPICLNDLLSCKVTRCGHLFCAPCVLQLLHLNAEGNAIECPICQVVIVKKQLRSARIQLEPPPIVAGDLVDFELVCRPRDSSSLVLPFDRRDTLDREPPRFINVTDTASKFQRVVLISDLSDTLSQQEVELNEALAAADIDTIQYVTMALEELKERQLKWGCRGHIDETLGQLHLDQSFPHLSILAEGQASTSTTTTTTTAPATTLSPSPSVASIIVDSHSPTSTSSSISADSTASEGLSASGTAPAASHASSAWMDNDDGWHGSFPDAQSDTEAASMLTSMTMTTFPMAPSPSAPSELFSDASPSSPASPVVGSSASMHDAMEEDGIFLFYQEESGRLVFLHPINVALLKHEFLASKRMPHQVAARVLEVEEMTATAAVRRRYPFVGHLPLASVFVLLEVDLTDQLSHDTCAVFADILDERRKNRLKRDQESWRTSEREQRLEKMKRTERDKLNRERLQREQQWKHEQQAAVLAPPRRKPQSSSTPVGVNPAANNTDTGGDNSSGSESVSFLQALRDKTGGQVVGKGNRNGKGRGKGKNTKVLLSSTAMRRGNRS
eukprot:TRINITY_DN235_c3_g3_i1.p1 TRINITY_DN235_c3_g3~~TRINITY_DN235_c3_g3_i1.p1  ORF type:complete len:810 (+),score=114.84 TRINITY_DN235_c3_g3_i1:1449-3878(+)